MSRFAPPNFYLFPAYLSSRPKPTPTLETGSSMIYDPPGPPNKANLRTIDGPISSYSKVKLA